MSGFSPHAKYKVRKKKFTINDTDREEFIINHEGLYGWWMSERRRMTMRQFIRANREEIDKVIKKESGES